MTEKCEMLRVAQHDIQVVSPIAIQPPGGEGIGLESNIGNGSTYSPQVEYLKLLNVFFPVLRGFLVSPDSPPDEKQKARPVRNQSGPKNTWESCSQSRVGPEGIQMFSRLRPAYRCLPVGSLGGRAKITSLGYHSTLQPFGL